jgi:hypothetical protein
LTDFTNTDHHLAAVAAFRVHSTVARNGQLIALLRRADPR